MVDAAILAVSLIVLSVLFERWEWPIEWLMAVYVLLVLWWGVRRDVVAKRLGPFGQPAVALLGWVPLFRGDVTWYFDHPRLKPGHTFMGMTSRGAEESRVHVVQAMGRSNSDDPVVPSRAFIRSDLTNEIVEMGFVVDGNVVKIDDTTGIPPRAEFTLATPPFPSPDSSYTAGISISRFLAEFGSFTFVFESDGKSKARRFSRHDIEQQVAVFDRSRNAGRLDREPRVRLRTTPPPS